MTTAEIIEAILSSDSMTLPIEEARKVIAESDGRVTWLFAGSDWARLVSGTPGTTYPTL
jgi:hypothetical protein